jgi:tRNA (guanine37-N1)-methyltransferase
MIFHETGHFSEKNCSIFVVNETIMRIDIITVLPQLLDGPLSHSIVKRAREKGLVEIYIHDLRDYALDRHRSVDDYPFGGEAGMVMSVEPIHRVISHLSSQLLYDEIIYTSPDGIRFDQQEANRLAVTDNLIILCGHYKGVDQRIRDHLITREISIGDYVLSGGELAAAVIADSIIRILPGAISDETSALTDSFQDGLLAPPVYTRPAEFHGWKVPEILLSGNTAKIEEWKHEQALERTKKLRPDLLKGNVE